MHLIVRSIISKPTKYYDTDIGFITQVVKKIATQTEFDLNEILSVSH